MGMLYCPNGRVSTSIGELELSDKVNAMQWFIAWCIDMVLIFLLYLSFILFFCILSPLIWVLLML